MLARRGRDGRRGGRPGRPRARGRPRRRGRDGRPLLRRRARPEPRAGGSRQGVEIGAARRSPAPMTETETKRRRGARGRRLGSAPRGAARADRRRVRRREAPPRNVLLVCELCRRSFPRVLPAARRRPTGPTGPGRRLGRRRAAAPAHAAGARRAPEGRGRRSWPGRTPRRRHRPRTARVGHAAAAAADAPLGDVRRPRRRSRAVASICPAALAESRTRSRRRRKSQRAPAAACGDRRAGAAAEVELLRNALLPAGPSSPRPPPPRGEVERRGATAAPCRRPRRRTPSSSRSKKIQTPRRAPYDGERRASLILALG